MFQTSHPDQSFTQATTVAGNASPEAPTVDFVLHRASILDTPSAGVVPRVGRSVTSFSGFQARTARRSPSRWKAVRLLRPPPSQD
jgi:hypothetical protein